jgi:hypothetical protein
MLEPAVFGGRLSLTREVDDMTWLVGLLVVALAVLAGSPWLFAHRAERRRRPFR